MAASAVLEELSAHLQKVDENPTMDLDGELIEKCELFTSTPEYQTSVWKETRPLFLQVAKLLPKLQQDPSALIHFILKLAAPYRFEDIKDVEFEIGLSLEAQPFHGLVLSLLEKTAASSADAHALANRPAVIQSIVRLWLCVQDVGVASQAAKLLLALLRVSKNEPGPVPGEAQLYHYGTAPIWKRLFNDKDISSLFYQYTSLVHLTEPGEPTLSKRDKTVAQSRLLEWLPLVGNMDWNTITAGHGSDVEHELGLNEDQGLLHYASLKMVDTADDVLMHMTLINFFSDLITKVKTSPHLTNYNSSLSLDFVKQHGIHKQIIDIHTSDNSDFEKSFLASRTAHYIAEYATTYPENFEKSSDVEAIRQFVHRNVKKCEPNDLSIIAAMPRASLVPQTLTGLAWDDVVILDIPIRRTNENALKTLATVFHGPPNEITFPQTAITSDVTTEKAFARLLTSLYYTKNTDLFAAIVSHAETIAMKENAFAALALLRALITANWASDTRPTQILKDDSIYLRLQEFPKTGIELILDPTISGGVLPYLLRPATTFSNLVGGKGDAEDAAYQVAMAKFDVLKALGKRLEEDGGRQDVLSMVRRRVAEGPWGVSGGVGSRISTLEL